jgi:hypothetical protein
LAKGLVAKVLATEAAYVEAYAVVFRGMELSCRIDLSCDFAQVFAVSARTLFGRTHSRENILLYEKIVVIASILCPPEHAGEVNAALS